MAHRAPSASDASEQVSAGFIVLGMHRSGTSVLARLLQASGASPGDRLVPGSQGNEDGHFEDAFAVETNERLLSALGYRWDDVRPLPGDWMQSDAAATARLEIRDYIRSCLARHRVWLIKDPRMCLVADVWLGALADEGVGHSVVLLGRHPLEVARSLAVRDGMATGKAMLSWLRHVLAAEQATRDSPRIFLTYDQLLSDTDGAIHRIRQLPGGSRLHSARAADGIVRPEKRHHEHLDSALPGPVALAWQAQQAAVSGPAELQFDRANSALQQADALFTPVVRELSRDQTLLWERTARAEALVADTAHRERQEDKTTALTDLCTAFMAFRDSNTAALTDLSRAFMRSQEDIPRLHGELSQSRAQVAMLEGELSQLEVERRSLVGDALRLNARLQALQHDSDLLQDVRNSLSWRITRPMRVFRRLLSNPGEREKLRAWCALKMANMRFLPPGLRKRMRGSVSAPVDMTGLDSEDPANSLSGQGRWRIEPEIQVKPAPARVDRPDVFVWAVIDWHFRMQRPQHLARSLAAAGHRVFYISNNLADARRKGFRIESLDEQGRLFQVNLNVEGAPTIYHDVPGASTIAQLRASVGELMQWADSDGGYCIVQHPFWSCTATAMPGSALLYDCMDHHAGFENNAPDVLAAEQKLISDADLLIVTSTWLDEALAPVNGHRALIRNGTEFAHFDQRPDRVFKDRAGRKIIGYYGAIAEWFDVELVRAVAVRFPDCLVLLVGNDTAGAAETLDGLDNVVFIGEVPYAELPYYLHAFDVALLPFRVIELTLATNPVKVYEYLSAGKPVVSVNLPEIAQFGPLVYRADSQEAFLDAVRVAITEPAADDVIQARKDFASEQTWDHRALQLDQAIAGLPAPMVSVIVLTYNNLEFTKACLRSLEEQSNWPQLEIIVVDNASSDGTREYLLDWAAGDGHRRAILNDSNLGFSAGNNVGLAAASGDYLILLNNDTCVTPNWIRTLVNHLKRNPDIGILGPVTNNIGNEARIEVQYDGMEQMRAVAAAYTRRHIGELRPIRTVAFFCVAMPRSTYEKVGPLDEDFGVGFFEDDDYCRRVAQAGLEVACAEDVFVHHHLSASFDKVKAETRQQLFLRNKALYEAKWGEWEPHAYRPSLREPQ